MSRAARQLAEAIGDTKSPLAVDGLLVSDGEAQWCCGRAWERIKQAERERERERERGKEEERNRFVFPLSIFSLSFSLSLSLNHLYVYPTHTHTHTYTHTHIHSLSLSAPTSSTATSLPLPPSSPSLPLFLICQSECRCHSSPSARPLPTAAAPLDPTICTVALRPLLSCSLLQHSARLSVRQLFSSLLPFALLFRSALSSRRCHRHTQHRRLFHHRSAREEEMDPRRRPSPPFSPSCQQSLTNPPALALSCRSLFQDSLVALSEECKAPSIKHLKNVASFLSKCEIGGRCGGATRHPSSTGNTTTRGGRAAPPRSNNPSSRPMASTWRRRCC